jgi:hypothetical protein
LSCKHPEPLVSGFCPDCEKDASLANAEHFAALGAEMALRYSEVLREAVKLVREHVGCGDNSCLFEKPAGMATNGGCQCVRFARPGVAMALANLYLAAKLVTSEGNK